MTKDAPKIECGDIIETPFGVMLVEKIRDDGTFLGHELGNPAFYKGTGCDILNSDFRYTEKAKSKMRIKQEARK